MTSQHVRRHRNHHPLVRILAVTVSVLLLAPMAGQTPTSAGPASASAGTAYLQEGQQDKPIPGGRVAVKHRPADPAEAAAARTSARPAPTWPEASTAEVELTSAASRATAGLVQAGSIPVWIGAAPGPDVQPGNRRPPEAPARLRVHAYDRATALAAGVEGIVLRLDHTDSGAAGDVQISVDYRSFAHAYGGSWAGRLRLVQMPACALTTPTLAGCTDVTPLGSRNDIRTNRVTATVSLSGSLSTVVSRPDRADNTAAGTTGTVVALTAGEASGEGDFGATTLSPSATWSAGGNSGGFSWSYPMRVPPSLGGPAPSINLAYSSQSVDGRTAASNNQPSWIGEGFDWQPGYIERRYKACADDMNTPGRNNLVKTYDLCWGTDNATVSLPGHTGELLKDGNDPDRWHLRHDDGSLIMRKTGAGNGARNGEWWVLIDNAGAQYWFGGVPSANSTWTVPVYGNNPTEPCNQTTYATSGCPQAWRWNLDRIVDVHGNTMTFTYVKETNKYGRNMSTTDLATYDRGGYVDRIDYGTRIGSSGSAPMQVKIDVSDRCLSQCQNRDAIHWPDTPWDQDCTAAPCNRHAPTSPSG